MPEAPLVIVNPAAGGGRGLRLVGWLSERLARRPEARLEVTTRPRHAEEIAADAASTGHDRVIAVGGDGTIQEVANGLIDGSPACSLGVLPVGSGNDFARSLGLPRDPAEAWTVAVGHAEKAVDIGRACDAEGRGRWFVSAGGIGFDAQVAAAMARRRGWQRGSAGYLVTTLTELRRFTNRHVTLTLDGQPSERTVLFIAIANGEYYGGGMRIAPGARIDDGTLDLCIVGDISRMTALRQLPSLYRGRHVDHPAVEMARARTLRIEGEGATRAHLDGEPFGRLPLTIELHPGSLTVAAGAGVGSSP